MRERGWWLAVAAVLIMAADARFVGSNHAPGSPDASPVGSSAHLTLVPLEREPPDGRGNPGAQAIAELREAVQARPRERALRFDLVRALRAAGRTPEALDAARAWREHDAYNLVVVRLLGDLLMEIGDRPRARRTYSAVTELLPNDVMAQRALGTALKQSGDLAGAYSCLTVCSRLAPQDARIRFEWADLAQRLDRLAEATDRFSAIASDQAVAEELRYPARQRLAQIWGAERRAALGRGDHERESQLTEAIRRLRLSGGIENDFKIFLTWDTDRTDVDLWVTTPGGEKIYYSHKVGRGGEALYHDVTTGYGPESFTAARAVPGTYLVQVNYFGGQTGGFSEARGEVQVLLNEGRADETRHALPYRLYSRGQIVTVAQVEVK